MRQFELEETVFDPNKGHGEVVYAIKGNVVVKYGNSYRTYTQEAANEILSKVPSQDSPLKKDIVNFTNSSPTGSLRKNQGKPEVSQIDPRFIRGLADLMTKSAKKYGKFNWALGQEYHTPYDSLMRHMLSFIEGEDKDPESGVSHLLHAAANCMILYTSQLKNNKDLDTRYKWE